MQKIKIVEKLEIIAILRVNIAARCRVFCNLRFNVPNEIPAVFDNGSNYDYLFIIKELAKEFEGQFECNGENSEKYKTFSVPIEKEI